MKRKRPNRWLKAVLNIGLVVAGLSAVSFLPADTSLKERRDAGILKLCVPKAYPPLVTGDPAAPGYDIELVQAIADGMGLRLVVNTLASIGADFNPRNWLLTRAQCDVIAGGVADTNQTRGFLQTVPTDAATGWVMVTRDDQPPAAGSTVAVLPGTSGLDRVALSSWMRQQGWKPKPVRSVADFERELNSGDSPAGVTERFIASTANLEEEGFALSWLGGESFQQNAMALGLWKGDQTLKTELVRVLQQFTNSTAYLTLRQKYQISGDIGQIQ